MKEFHIISSGVSLITNAQRKGILPKDRKISDEEYWRDIFLDDKEVKKLYSFLKENPMENSAELNTFLRVVKNKNAKDIEVYLFGTNTKSNELCRLVIGQYIKELGYVLYDAKEIAGYFGDRGFDEKYARDEFQKDISLLLDRLIYLGRKKIKEGYKVYYNPTGGFKAHVIATALAGFMVDSFVYYMNEEFNEVIFLPKMFYLPKGREIEILKKINDKGIISGSECEKLIDEYTDEIDRLNLYGLLDIEIDDTGKIYRLKLTNKGKLILEKIK